MNELKENMTRALVNLELPDVSRVTSYILDNYTDQQISQAAESFINNGYWLVVKRTVHDGVKFISLIWSRIDAYKEDKNPNFC